MAISLITTPDWVAGSSPAYDHVPIECTSNAPTVVRMKCTVSVTDSDTAAGAIIASPQIVVDPLSDVTSEFFIDLQAILRDYMTGYAPDGDVLPVKDAASNMTTAYGSSKYFTFTLTEVLLTGGLLTDGASLTAGNDGLALNTGEAMAQYLSSNNNVGKFLTEYPRDHAIGIGRDENLYLSGIFGHHHTHLTVDYLFNAAGVSYHIIIERFDSDGVTLGTAAVALGTGSDKPRRWDIGVGTSNLGASITAATYSYDVWLQATILGVPYRITEKMAFEIDETCYDERNYKRLLWVNDLGGLDFFSFKAEIVKERETEKETMERPLGYGYTSERHERRTLRTSPDNITIVTSDPLHEDVRHWLSGVLDDYRTWVEGATYSAAQILTDSVEYVNRVDGRYQLSFSFIPSQRERRQHG